MARKAYIGVNHLARKVKKIYVGINGVARKVKRGYIGVNGIARLFFAGRGVLHFYSEYAERITADLRTAAASNSSYAFVTNGELVNSFDKHLVCSVASSLPSGLAGVCGANAAGEYAVFGGSTQSDGHITDVPVYAYNKSATRVSANSITSETPTHITGNNNTYAMFGAGTATIGGESQDNTAVDLYNQSLTRVSVSVQQHYSDYCISNNGKYAIVYGGGNTNNNFTYHVNKVDAINTSGTATAMPDMSISEGSFYPIGVRAGNYAICAGGWQNAYSGGTKVSVSHRRVNVFDKSLTMSIASPITYDTSIFGQDRGATADEDYGIVPTIDRSGSSYVGHYEAYDPELVKQTYTREGSGAQYQVPAATSFRRYALFFRGINSSSTNNTVDVFESV